ncbi:hypothetical protein [Campylobacter rectus]|uniref:hypothetical protein n=1 Tax=Campylobacter rectus TaxID=203 RepID=UPI0023F02567|nr:hypothetical protein [Campylobacter rectus]
MSLLNSTAKFYCVRLNKFIKFSIRNPSSKIYEFAPNLGGFWCLVQILQVAKFALSRCKFI